MITWKDLNSALGDLVSRTLKDAGLPAERDRQDVSKPVVRRSYRIDLTTTDIQGTAADIIKIAMIRVSDRLEKEGLQGKLILQVHDELIVECPPQEREQVVRILQEEMEGAVCLSVPMLAEAGWGRTWYDAKG